MLLFFVFYVWLYLPIVVVVLCWWITLVFVLDFCTSTYYLLLILVATRLTHD